MVPLLQLLNSCESGTGLKSTETIARSTGFILTQDSTIEMTYAGIFSDAVRQWCRESEFADVDVLV